MNNTIKKIIVVGGGSAGWMAASYIAKALNFNAHITVIESSSIGRIGVGEATVPTIKTEFFDKLGIPECEWMPQCNASYKMGVKFLNWKNPDIKSNEHYYHNFGEIPTIDGVPLTHIWLKKYLEQGYRTPMDYACFDSLLACEKNKSPNLLDGTQVQHYAYHFDAALLAGFLKKWSMERGVHHGIANLVSAKQNENGYITSLVSDTGQEFTADLFIDCSGFAGFLIDKVLKEPIVSFEESLLTDRAISLNIPSESNEDIRPYTTSFAMKAGWMWQIPLFNRSGNGYVYSSQFISDEDADREIRQYFGKKADNIESKFIKFQSRRRENSWVKNVVSIGLASSFLEPLESTGIYFIYAALYQLIDNFPDKSFSPILRNRFNSKVNFMVDDVKDFIVMHFKTSPRTDTDFWLTNKHDTKIPESLNVILEKQKLGIPIRMSHQGDESLYSSFAARFDNFWTNSSYQCIFSGVDYFPDASLPILNYRDDIMSRGEEILAKIQEQSLELCNTLPSQRDYLEKIYSIVDNNPSVNNNVNIPMDKVE